MPLVLFLGVLENGIPEQVRQHSRTIIYTILTLTLLTLLKIWTSGRKNPSPRLLHGKVVMMTGGTSGIGAQTALGLAAQGAQLVLLSQAPPSDPFLVEYIQDLRQKTNNQMIYTEQVDLSDFYSIRTFATKWIDNAPPRRLDMIILCAATMTPPGGKRRETEEGIEETWMINFLANFHLLGILSPALRAQPIDRDVRVIIPTCSSYIGSPSLKEPVSTANWSPGTAYARSKLAMNVFGQAFQKHLDAYERPDKAPNNTRVVFVDPGLARTPSTRRWLTRGSLWGLAIYLAGYLVPWFLLKSPHMAAQSILYTAMDNDFARGPGGKLIKECMEVDFARKEVKDEEVAKKLWQESDALIEKVEKIQAKKRAAKKAADEKNAKEKTEKEKEAEIEELVDAIKKGKEKHKKAAGKKGKK
ncbi:alcohol dehydrogenase [Fusarium verticillioides 7600]|uniref:Alcohol dehydrogenase n=1 Tax=Gibberella moniliformis (strain M3125 / FGSC 7600) TaxID=334819 RepID=W7MD65_GIBM7|nr:alcohol dehydrogenase [Fusarium verticillioides 7600]EWG42742.1 alcohol dehydrogenase [Fusarium verticillioides 7600]